MDLEFRLLGPLEVRREGRLIPIEAAKQRAVLAALLIEANRVVSMDALIDRLWEDSPPGSARNTVQNYVLRLRRALGTSGIVTRGDGYQFTVSTDSIDLHRFTDLVHAARSHRDPERASRQLAAALVLWRGRPLCDVPSERMRQDVVPALMEQYLSAQEQRIDAELELGRHFGVVAQLWALAAEHPLRERLWAQLMLALYRCGRQAEALSCYRTVSKSLADEVGVGAGPNLRHLHQRMLRHDPELSLVRH